MKTIICLQIEIEGKLPSDVITVTNMHTFKKVTGRLGHIIRPEIPFRNNPSVFAEIELID